MESKKNTISACLVVYNEEKVIGKCLESIKDLVDEIIVVHDGECNDDTLTIAQKYTKRIFVREHIGLMEGHLTFAFNQTTSEWILRIDADEYFDTKDVEKIKNLVTDDAIDGYQFKWELWDGKKAVRFQGLQKLCLARRIRMSYNGIPNEPTRVKGRIKNINIVLHHRPAHSNVAWDSFLKKSKKWIPVYTKYFFPELVIYECFQDTSDEWLIYAERVRNYSLYFLIAYPLKNFLGQLKNGLWKSRIGRRVALQQYVGHFLLYLEIWKMKRKLKSH